MLTYGIFASFQAQMQAIVQTIREIVNYSPLFGQQISLLLHPSHNVSDNPIYLCDLVATLVQSAETDEVQAVMSETSVGSREGEREREGREGGREI